MNFSPFNATAARSNAGSSASAAFGQSRPMGGRPMLGRKAVKTMPAPRTSASTAPRSRKSESQNHQFQSSSPRAESSRLWVHDLVPFMSCNWLQTYHAPAHRSVSFNYYASVTDLRDPLPQHFKPMSSPVALHHATGLGFPAAKSFFHATRKASVSHGITKTVA